MSCLIRMSLLLCICLSLAHAEVVVIDGEDHLLLPADLVAGNSGSLFWANAYEMSVSGHLILSDIYKRVYKFDEETLTKIDGALTQLENDYFKHIHENGKIKKEINGTLIFEIVNSQAGMDAALKRYKSTVDALLSDKQKPVTKYFDIFTFAGRSGNSKLIMTDNEPVIITLTLPKSLRPFDLKQDDTDPEVAALIKKLEEAEAEMHAGGNNHQEFMRIRRQLSKLGVNMGNQESYSIEYRHPDHHSSFSTSSSSSKSGEFTFFERAYRFHVDGSLE